MKYPIKGSFKSFFDYVRVKGHNEKEFDPKQIKNINNEEKILYLTFDTCPTNEVDFEIVNWLISNKISSSIFLNVDWFKNNYDKGLDFLSNDLFLIGGHGYNHIRPARQNFQEQKLDIDECINFIRSELRIDVKWYRCPFGKPNEDTFAILDPLKIRYASWAGHVFDKADFGLENPNKTSNEYYKNYTKSGDIWIFHINKEGVNSFETLKNAYEWARKEGYRFEKLPS